MVMNITLVWKGTAFGRQVIDPGLGSEFFEERITGVIPDQFAEADGFPCGAIGHGIFVLIAEPVNTVRACGYTRWKFAVAKPVSTEKAFGNGTFLLRNIGFYIIGHSFILFSIAGFSPVENASGVWTCGNTEPAADAPFIVDKHNAVLAFEGGVYRANLRAGRIVAVHAGFGHVIRCCVGGILHLKHIHMMLFRPELVVILTGVHTFTGVSASCQIDYHNPFAPR